MFILIRRKYIQLVVVIFLLFGVLLSLLSLVNETSKARINSTLRLNYFDRLTSVIYNSYFNKKYSDNADVYEPGSRFNRQVDEIRDQKLASEDEAHELWILDNSVKGSRLNVPGYYYDGSDLPPIQPFDVRFTLGIYYHHLRTSMQKNPGKPAEAPFHWYDWVDMSVLNQYLLAPQNEKAGCALLDARQIEEKMINDKQRKADREAKQKQQEDQRQAGVDAQRQKAWMEEQNRNQQSKREEKRESLAPEEFCVDDTQLPAEFNDGNKLHPGFNVFKSSVRTTPDKAILIGKSHLYSYAPPPVMIIFLTKDGSYNITTSERKKLLDSDLVKNYVSKNKMKSINALEQFKKLQRVIDSNKHQNINAYEIQLPEESFQFKHEQIIEDYERTLNEGKNISRAELTYLDSLKYSDNSVKNGGPPKYFAEARLLGSLVGDHYDWRFFNGVMYEASLRSLILHRLIRSWLSFSRKNGINTWVAHGSLLSWYWNGFAFPWDYDIDVQVPIMDLHKLSLHFNQTLVVEDMEDGYGRYFLDCGSFITLRERGNGNNNIDARFIDVDSGVYIDITGLAVSNSKPPDRYKEIYPEQWNGNPQDYTVLNTDMKAFNCRNNHFSTLDELSPLVKTFVEGETAYVPKKYSEILTAEYSKGLMNKKYGAHVFVPQLRLWVKEDDLYYFLNDRETWKSHKYNAEYTNIGSIEDLKKQTVQYELTEEQKTKLLDEAEERKKHGETRKTLTKLSEKDMHRVYNFKENDLLELLTKNELLINYYLTRDFTFFHEEEVMRLLFGKSTEPLFKKQTSFKPFKTNIFDYNFHNNEYNYDDEIVKYLSLSIAYLEHREQLKGKSS